MEIVGYYYKLLGLDYNANKSKIITAYKLKINNYTNLPFLTDNQKNEIKELKKARYILINKDLKKIYDFIINEHLKETTKITTLEKNSFKKEKIDSNLMSDRIFSMAHIINPPQKNIDIDRNFSFANK
jgi:DnaJ-class molecular chaperone